MISDNIQGLEKLWITNEIPQNDIQRISKEANVSPFLAKILLGRGMSDIESIKDFINPSLGDLHDPFLIDDMEKAVERIKNAIDKKERILIYGDYDVDGITSTSVLINFLSGLTSNIGYYIPDRIDEGYGLSMSAIDKIKESGPGLIITVDCGITAVDEVKYINECGIDVIITDHHECKEILPDAYAIISPCMPDSSYPFSDLAGVGVVYKLIAAICMKMGLGDIYNCYLDLVTLGTVADVVPLVDENRVIVKHGLKFVENTQNVGLKVLLDNCGIKDKKVTSWVISFIIAPRINAAGRVGNAGRAVELLTTADKDKASEIVTQLNEENKFRQETEQEIFLEAVSTIENSIDLLKDKVIVVAGEGWHHGVIGIVASKITERYYRPCILISYEEGMGKGSGRSIEGFDLFKALSHCSDLLDKFGGHELAAGLSLRMDNVPAFRKKINLYAEEIMDEEDLHPKVRLDMKIDKEDVSMDNIRELELLAPFGAGNPGPLFEYDDLRINDIRTVGDGRHLKLLLENCGVYLEAIGFGLGSMLGCLNKSDLVDVACTMEINTWNSVNKIQLNLKDIKPNQDMELEDDFFYSLDKCMLEAQQDGVDAEVLQCMNSDLADEEILIDKMVNVAKGGKNVVLLLNSLSGIKNIEKKLRKYAVGIKKPYTICYTSFNCKNPFENKLLVLVNPSLEEIDFSTCDYVVICGKWINPAHVQGIVNKVDKSRLVFIKCEREKLTEICELVPDRKDLVAVYQYIRANAKNGCIEENLFKLAKNIAESYKMSMNYFKLKKSIEIFDELGLVHKEQKQNCVASISIIDKGKEKTNIDKSLLYRRLQVLKSGIGVIQ